MSSLIPDFEYDIFISYRHNDNKSGWVTEFVKTLQEEVAAAIKDPVSIYFDHNADDGLLETHHVAKSLEGKLKCLIFIPIISQTYCDQRSFAWQHEFCAFNKASTEDHFGRDIKLTNGNVASRILPIRIHEIDAEDTALLTTELGTVPRSIEMIFKTSGVNRPLRPQDRPEDNVNKTFYRDQVNKVANGIKEIIQSLKNPKSTSAGTNRQPEIVNAAPSSSNRRSVFIWSGVVLLFVASVLAYVIFTSSSGIDISDKSIAVLPFENMSGDAGQEYFSDGISEEILNALAQIDGLKVTGRTSSFQFKGKGIDIKEVGEKLGVATILEGSIRKQDDQLRITVKLVNTKDGYDLWSERFDRNVTDIFAIQDEIAQAVSSRLKLTLLNGATQPKVVNNEAYDLYLQGRYLYNKRGQALVKARELFEQAITLDPGFSIAHEALSLTYLQMAYYDMIPSLQGIEEAKKWAWKAIELEPNSSEAYASLGFLAIGMESKWTDGRKFLEKAVAINPGNAFSQSFNATYLIFVAGDLPQAEQKIAIASELDPLYFVTHLDRGRIQIISGDYEQALNEFRKAEALKSYSRLPFTLMAQALMLLGQTDQAIKVLEENIESTSRTPAMVVRLCEAYAESGNGNKSLALYHELQASAKTGYVTPFVLAEAAVAVNKLDEAFMLFDLALQQKTRGFLDWNYWPYHKFKYRAAFMRDPRYKKIMDRLAFPKKAAVSP